MKEKIINEQVGGQLYIVGTPIGNMQDITYRAIETLKFVDIILAEDTRQTKKILDRYGIVKTCISYHRHNEVEKIEQVLQLLKEGKNVALVSDAGMPRISDPGEKLIQTIVEQKITYTVIPGVTALTTAVAGCKFDATTFVFIGFLPMHSTRRHSILEKMKDETKLMVLYEAPHKLLKTLEDLHKVLGNRNICIARELTKIYEEYNHTNIIDAIDKVKTNGIKGEIVLLIESKQCVKQSDEVIISNEKPRDVRKLVNEKINSGMKKNDAIKAVAKELGIKKQEVYMECVSNE